MPMVQETTTTNRKANAKILFHIPFTFCLTVLSKCICKIMKAENGRSCTSAMAFLAQSN